MPSPLPALLRRAAPLVVAAAMAGAPPTPAPAPEPRARAVPSVFEDPGEEEEGSEARRTVPVLAGPFRGTVKAQMGSPVRRELFGDGSPAELRKAIVLREVLGPPVGLREE